MGRMPDVEQLREKGGDIGTDRGGAFWRGGLQSLDYRQERPVPSGFCTVMPRVMPSVDSEGLLQLYRATIAG